MSKVFIRIQGLSILGFGLIMLLDPELGGSILLFPDIFGYIALLVGLYATLGSLISMKLWCRYIGYILVMFNVLATVLSIMDFIHGQPNLLFWMTATILLFELEAIARSGVECG